MKKLNITKKQYDESKYFTNKYGNLKYMSESGKLYKTDKGVVLALEATEDGEEDKGKEDDEEPKGAEEIDGSEEEVTVKKEDLANALQGVIDTVKDIAADNDVELPGEEGDEEEDGPEDGLDDKLDDLDDLGDEEGEFEFGEGGEDVCPTCGCKKGSCKKKEDECTTTECGGKTPKMESVRRARRIRMMREARARRLRAKKVLESIKRRRIAKKILESARRRRLAKRVLESVRRRRALKRMMESRKALHPRRVKMMESVRPRGVRRIRRVAR